MADTLSGWLHVREPADIAARSEELVSAVARVMADARPLSVLDLATGTGSNVRYLMPRLGGSQRWLVVDRDPVLLARLPDEMRTWGAALGYEVETGSHGLVIRGQGLECAVESLQLDLDQLADVHIFKGRHLVTASALLDLVSEQWLRALVKQCRAERAAALFALSYDGSSHCSPEEPEDEAVRALLNQHQERDKGLGGPAAGPAAANVAVQCFEEAGFCVRHTPTNWVLGAAEADLQRMLVDGWAQAASELGCDAGWITNWRDRRVAHIRAGVSRMTVGHVDMAAWLPEGDRPDGTSSAYEGR